jgi:hypothetical protein
MSLSQQQELWLGPGNSGSVFRSDEHRREVWFRFREKLMQLWGKNGKRPYGWWRYEGSEWGLPSRHPGVHERSILYEFSDALSAQERVELEQFWRREFDRSFDEHFFYCAGPDKIYSGDDARWQHWLFVDLPPPLLDKLMVERQRRGEVVCELQEESQHGEAVTETSSPPDNERHAG